jgi:undecaprenyl-diphosphatase
MQYLGRMGQTEAMDMNRWLFFVINGWAGHDSLLDGVMIFCARDLIYVVFAIALAWLLLALYRHDFGAAAFFVTNLVVAFILLQIARHAYIEPRPFVTWHVTQLMPHAADQSFPSDHTTAASAIAFGLMLFAKLWKSGAVLLLVALVIGFARIFAGVHYPVDIGGGVLTAAVSAAIVYAVYRFWWLQRESNLSRRSPPIAKDPQ